MDASAAKGARYTLFLLFLINFLNFFDRVIPAVVLEPLRKEFSLGDTQLGMLSTAFTLIYAVAGIPLGRLADRVKRTRILAGGVFIWSLMTAASGLATNYASLFLIRLGVGVGEASCAPAANAMIGDLYPSQKRARALGVFMLGLPIGNIAAFSLVGALAHAYGWRVPFFLAAVPGLILVPLIAALKEPVRGAQEAKAVDLTTPIERPFLRILTIPTVWWIILSGAAANFAAYAMNAFLPALLMRYHGLNIQQAGGASSVVVGLTGLIGLTAGGALADRLHQSFPRGRLTLGAVSLLIASPLLWFGLGQPIGGVALLCIFSSVGWLLFYLYYVTVYSALQDVVESRLRATAMAVYFFFQYVLGAAFGTTVAGALSDAYATRAMVAAGAHDMTNVFRAQGLQASMRLTVPVAVFVTAMALWFASRTFVADAKRAS
ncbi:MFS transporter [Pendulispora rubella]|uniref:MFS transporter n=1 Tax=Pendulispora rubella TaxID=2741070 RepID=A0ABZ2L4C2_9BACT